MPADAPLRRNVKRPRATSKGQAKTHTPTGVFGGLAPATAPLARAKTQARKNVERAQTRLPERPVPAVPVLRKYTPAQKRTSAALVKRSRVQQAGGRSRSAAKLNALDRELLQDPRSRQKLQGARLAAALTPHQRAVIYAQARRDTVKPGPQHKHKLGVGFASITVNPHAALQGVLDFQHIRSALPTLGATARAVGTLGKPLISDAKTLAEAPFIGGYELGAGAVQALTGHGTGRLERLGSGVVKGITESAPAALVTGHPGLAAKRFGAHPLIEALNFAGAESVLGRGAGAALRGTGRKAGSTVRPSLALTDQPGSRIVHHRSYSKDSIRKAAQVIADKQRAAAGYVDERGVPVLKSGTFQSPHRSERERLLDARTDYTASRVNSGNRMTREKAASDIRSASPTARRMRNRVDREIVPLAVEGTIRGPQHALADLHAHRAKLAATLQAADTELKTLKASGVPKQEIFRHKTEMAATAERVKTIDRFLASKPTPERVTAILKARGEIGQRLNANDLAMAQARLGNIHQLRRSRLFPYAQEHMGAKYTEDIHGQQALRHPDGRFLSNTEIEAHAQAHGVDPKHLAYLPHRLDIRGSRAFYSQFRGGGRPTLKNEPRTGALYAKGATGTSFDTVVETAVRQETQVKKAQEVDRFVHENALRKQDGTYFTSKEATELAQRLHADTGEAWTPVSAVPAKLAKAEQEAVRQGQDPRKIEGLQEQLINSRIDAAKTGNARNVVLVPSRMVDRLAEHVAPAGGTERFFQLLNRPFRFAVLAQPKWIAGNFIEPFFVRLPTRGSGIFLPGLLADFHSFRRAMGSEGMKVLGHQITPPRQGGFRRAGLDGVVTEIQAEHLGGLFIGNKGATVRRTGADLPGIGGNIQVIAKLPVVHQIAWFAKHAATIIGKSFFAFNRVLERQFQKAEVGHQFRQQAQEFTGSWLKAMRMSGTVAKQLGDGYRDTAALQRLARQTDDMLGKYQRFSPTLRRLAQTLMPFVPWFLAAARFVFWTMPVHNSAKTALLVKLSQVNQQAWKDAHADVPPGSLKLAIPTSKGGLVDLARYTPYGLTGPVAEGDVGMVTDPLLPQISGVEHALNKQDPFGRGLQVNPATGDHTGQPTGSQLAGIVANSAAESFLPLVAQIRRLREGGGTPYADSNVFSPKTKPGSSHMSAVRRTLDPFRPTYLRGGPASGGSAPTARGTIDGIQRDRVSRASAASRDRVLNSIQQDRVRRASSR